MATLLIRDVPDELCVTYSTLPNEARRVVLCAVVDAIQQFARVPPTLEELEDFHRRQRELREAGVLQPVPEGFIEETIARGRRCS